MKAVFTVLICSVLAWPTLAGSGPSAELETDNFSWLNNPDQMTPLPDQQKVAAITCFKSGEERAGMNKICYYNCAGSRAAITISSTSLCPLSINR